MFRDEKKLYADDDGLVSCPDCGSENLHQESCEVIFRDEDKDGLLTIVENGNIETGYIQSPDIPFRRDSMYINFSCEHCEGIKSLFIAQHKGCTFMAWEEPEVKLLNERAQ